MKAVSCLFLILLLSGCGDVVVRHPPQKTGETVLAEACEEMAYVFCREMWGWRHRKDRTRCRVAQLRKCLSE